MGRRLDWDKAAKKGSARVPRSDLPSIGWWLTISNGGRCDECGERMPKGSTIAYNHAEKRALCPVCVDRLGIVAPPSKRLLLAQRQEKLL